MRRSPTLILAGILVLTATSCETLSPEEYQKFTVIDSSFQGHGIYVRLQTRPQVTQTFHGWIPPDAKAILLWFPGGEGREGNMELDTILLQNRIGFVNVPPPSDRPEGFVWNIPFRSSSAHLRDIGAVIGYLKKEKGLPIWLMGLSMGTVSIGNAATRLPDAIDGVVFLSSITAFTARGYRARGETLVTEMSLKKITVPVLAIAHAQDSEPTSPPHGAEEIVRWATNTPVKEAKIFSAGPDVSPGERFHIFAGIRAEVADYIAKFILANLGARPHR